MAVPNETELELIREMQECQAENDRIAREATAKTLREAAEQERQAREAQRNQQ